MKIPILNIYYLLCYAWEALKEGQTLVPAGVVESTDLLDLFASVLVNGTRRLRQRGLDRSYLPRQDEIPGVRGRLLVTQTLRRNLLCHGRTACVWDELEYDTLPNRILKTTLLGLEKARELDERTRDHVHDMLRWLEPLQEIELRHEHFRCVQLHRNIRIYGLLLNICEFIFESSLPTEQGAHRRFRDFIRDRLWKLFQDFVFKFYKRELPDWNVESKKFRWQMVGANKDADDLVPDMETDVCLRRAGRAIILDTKFYAQALKGSEYGGEKLIPSHLYQLFAYLRQSGWESAEGVLLYPQTTREFSAEFTTYGHRIRAVSLDLAKPWQSIYDRLLQIVKA